MRSRTWTILDDTLIYLDHRRQRRLGGRHAAGRLQRDGQLQRHGRDRNAGIHDVQARRVRRRGIVRPLRGGLGVGDELAVPVDQAGGVALGRHAQRHHRALAQGDQGEGRHRATSSATSSTSRRPCWKRPASPSRRRSTACMQSPYEGHEHALQLQRRQGGGAARDAVLRDVLQPRHLPQGLERGDQAPHAVG